MSVVFFAHSLGCVLFYFWGEIMSKEFGEHIQKGTDIYMLTSLSSYEKVQSVSEKTVMIYQLNQNIYICS